MDPRPGALPPPGSFFGYVSLDVLGKLPVRPTLSSPKMEWILVETCGPVVAGGWHRCSSEAPHLGGLSLCESIRDTLSIPKGKCSARCLGNSWQDGQSLGTGPHNQHQGQLTRSQPAGPLQGPCAVRGLHPPSSHSRSRSMSVP